MHYGRTILCDVCLLPSSQCACAKDGALVQLLCRHLDNTFSCLVDCACGHPCCAHTTDLGCMAGDCDCLAFTEVTHADR